MAYLTEIVENAFLRDYSPKAFINLTVLKQNVENIKGIVGTKLCAVVKADAYGHGLCRVAEEIQPLVDRFAVASLYDASSLRIAGVEKPIICLLPVADIAAAVRWNVEISVVDREDFERIISFVQATGVKPSIHFAVNTGMNRFGYDQTNVLKNDVLRAEKLGLNVVGVFSHFYNSADYESTRRQYKKFAYFAETVKNIYPDALAHIAASGAAEYGEFNADMVRIGMLMYGYMPVNGTFNVNPVMKVFAYSGQCRHVASGSNLLYGDYKIKSDEDISLLSYGYFDGLDDYLGLNGSCMNITAVKGRSRLVEVSKNLENIATANGKGIYKTLIDLGRVREKIYYK